MITRATLRDNPIYQGYPWAQLATFPTGFIAGRAVRADFRVEVDGDPVFAAGVFVDADQVTFSLSETQTAAMAFGIWRADVTIGDEPTGLQLEVPVAGLTTER